MFSEKFVVSVKSAGKVLREFGDTVYVPFNSEFSLYLKNLNSRRAEVKVSIDGDDVLNGSALIVNANQSIDLERYLKDLDRGNRFKFVQRSDSIENHRGIKAEDGLIRVEFAYEKALPTWNNLTYPPGVRGGIRRSYIDPHVYGGGYSLNAVGSTQCNASVATFSTQSAQINDAGITVPGSISDQKFSTASGFATDESFVIVLKLVGDVGQNHVKKAVTVKTKTTCVTCGRVNKATSKFCTECGTALEVV